MPCISEYPEETSARIQREVDFLTNALCNIISNMTPQQRSNIDNSVRLWWESHKRADAKRLRLMAEQTKKEQQRRAALKKLTKAERKLLGIEF